MKLFVRFLAVFFILGLAIVPAMAQNTFNNNLVFCSGNCGDCDKTCNGCDCDASLVDSSVVYCGGGCSQCGGCGKDKDKQSHGGYETANCGGHCSQCGGCGGQKDED